MCFQKLFVLLFLLLSVSVPRSFCENAKSTITIEEYQSLLNEIKSLKMTLSSLKGISLQLSTKPDELQKLLIIYETKLLNYEKIVTNLNERISKFEMQTSSLENSNLILNRYLAAARSQLIKLSETLKQSNELLEALRQDTIREKIEIGVACFVAGGAIFFFVGYFAGK